MRASEAPSLAVLPTAAAAALARARHACDALDVGDSLRPQMEAFLRAAAEQLQQHGTRPPQLPHRRDHLHKLKPSSAKRPARERAFEAAQHAAAR